MWKAFVQTHKLPKSYKIAPYLPVCLIFTLIRLIQLLTKYTATNLNTIKLANLVAAEANECNHLRIMYGFCQVEFKLFLWPQPNGNMFRPPTLSSVIYVSELLWGNIPYWLLNKHKMGHMYSCYKASVLASWQAVACRPSEQCKHTNLCILLTRTYWIKHWNIYNFNPKLKCGKKYYRC